ncbi:hypothetical protein FGRMN_10462 [Fusarium graminum]|nr:hypothetical protein FGRMN_10462 [Fusarium graminum]
MTSERDILPSVAVERAAGILQCQKRDMIDRPPQDGGLTAWLQVLGSFLINLNNFGLANSFGVFQIYYQTELLQQHSPSSISWIGTLQASLILIIGVISGPLFDKGYFYSILITSSIVLVFALMMLSLATQYYQVMLTWGALCGLCTGLLYSPSVAMIPMYFTSRRGLAIGCATAGGPFGGVIYPIIVRRCLDTGGFGWACRAIGFTALVTLTIAIILIKPSSRETKRSTRQLFDKSIIEDKAYIVFVISAFFIYLGFMVPFILTPSFTLSGLDQHPSPELAYYMLSVINAGQVLGRIIPGALVDMRILGPEYVLIAHTATCGILGFCWVGVHSLGGFTALLVLYGLFSGAVVTMPAFIIPYLSPSLAVIGTRMGIVYSAAGFGALIGAPIALAVDSVTSLHHRGDFLGLQLWSGSTIVFGGCLCIYPLVEARKRRLAITRKA